MDNLTSLISIVASLTRIALLLGAQMAEARENERLAARTPAPFGATAAPSPSGGPSSLVPTAPPAQSDERLCVARALAPLDLYPLDIVYDAAALQGLSDALGVTILLRNKTPYSAIFSPSKGPRSCVIPLWANCLALNCDDHFKHCEAAEWLAECPKTDSFWQADLWDIQLEGKKGRKRSNRSKRGNRPDNGNFFEKEFRVQRPSPLDRQVLRTVKTYQPAQIVTSTTGNTFRSYAFSISNLSDVVEMASVFDQYRITQVDCKFIPNITEALSSTPVAGTVASVIDFDDANVFTSLTDPLDYSSLSMWKPLETIQLTFKPRMAMGAYGSSVFGSFANVAPQWIDAASATVEHYGLKLAFGSTTTAITYSPIFRLHVEWRALH